MRLELNEDQKMIRDTARRFAEEVVMPVIDTFEQEGRFPFEIVRKLGEMGFMGMLVPEKYGGADMDMVSYAVLIEELSRASASIGVTISVHSSVASAPIAAWGTEAQKERYLPRLAAGELIGGMALTEPDAGSDVSGISTTAVKDGGDYILNGNKIWVTNGTLGGVIMLITVTGRKPEGGKVYSAFIVEPDAPGLEIIEMHGKMGLRASGTAELVLEDCRLPAAALLGEEGSGLRVALGCLDGGRIGIGAQSLGIARACLDEAIKYAKERTAFGRPIGEFGAIGDMIAETATEVDAARLLIHQACETKDAGAKASIRQASMAKLYASETANRAAYRALQVHGGYGYMEEYRIERLYREARITTIYEGTSEIQRKVIARELNKDF